MKKQWVKILLITLTLVFIESWFLCALRFEWEPGGVIFSVLNVPFGYLYLFFEKHLWNIFGASHWVNDEITGILFWISYCACQGLFYFFLVRKIKLFRREKVS